MPPTAPFPSSFRLSSHSRSGGRGDSVDKYPHNLHQRQRQREKSDLSNAGQLQMHITIQSIPFTTSIDRPIHRPALAEHQHLSISLTVIIVARPPTPPSLMLSSSPSSSSYPKARAGWDGTGQDKTSHFFLPRKTRKGDHGRGWMDLRILMQLVVDKAGRLSSAQAKPARPSGFGLALASCGSAKKAAAGEAAAAAAAEAAAMTTFVTRNL